MVDTFSLSYYLVHTNKQGKIETNAYDDNSETWQNYYLCGSI